MQQHKQCTNEHQAMVIKPCTKSCTIQDYYQITRAEANLPKFYIGKPPKEDPSEKEDADLNVAPEDMTAWMYK